MPKIKCICNYTIGLGEIPSPNQLMIIKDVEFDQIEDNATPQDIYMKMKVVAQCPNCGRLHIFWDDFSQPQTIYNIEDDG